MRPRRPRGVVVFVLVTIAAAFLVCWGMDRIPPWVFYQPVKWALRMQW